MGARELTKLIAEIINSIDKNSFNDCLDTISQNILDLSTADTCVIYMKDISEDELYLAAIVGKPGFHHENIRLKLGQGIAGWVGLHQTSLIIDDCRTDDRFAIETGITREKHPQCAVLAVPLFAFDQFIGVIEVINYSGKIFNDLFIKKIQPLANIVALAIPRGADESFIKLAEVCIRFLEEKDRYTHGHSLRVMTYAMMIANEILLPQSQKEELRLCSLLHDIGKVVIKDALLSKEGPLTKNEMATIRMHSTIGFNIVEKISRNLSRKILSHHERFDGTGYPNGLRGEEIPLISRIIAIADALDAMTSERPYRKAKELDYAVNEIAANSGTQFDPLLVDALFQAYENGKIKIKLI